MDFWEAYPILMDFEGHGTLADHPSDPGGKTKWGITEATAKAAGFDGTMESLTLGTAMSITQDRYWNAVKADQLPEPIRYVVFDGAFHSGPAQSIKWLQKACRVAEDGVLGPQTLAAVQKNDPYILKARICGARLEFMTNLNHFTVFGKGWTRRIAAILEM